jgi:hypothetical protein
MTAGKKIPVFLICSLLLTVPGFLSAPAAAHDSTTVVLSGTIPLVMFGISVTGIDGNNATISWKTNGDANSTVEYGTTTSYGLISSSGLMAKDHMQSLHSLVPGTVYHYRVMSADLAGNRAVSSDSSFSTQSLSPVIVVPAVTSGEDWSNGDIGRSISFTIRQSPTPETLPIRQGPQRTGSAPEISTAAAASAAGGSNAPTGPSGNPTFPSETTPAGLMQDTSIVIILFAALVAGGILVASIRHYQYQMPKNRE